MDFNYLSPKAETRKSKIAGRGTFAKKTIKKGELIAIFGGKIVDSRRYQKLPKQAREECFPVHDDFYIGPTNSQELGKGDFVNHSCNPNAGINGQILLVARRDIQPGEEITFDYGTTDADSNPVWRMKCYCGAANCRKMITSEDWKDKKFQEKHKGYFAYHVQRKIDEAKKHPI
jgi:SET domain-containing protein